MIRAGIIGAAGYTAGELVRILLRHPEVRLTFLHSRSHAGEPVYRVHRDLVGETDQAFTDTVDTECDVIFLCLGHGESRRYLQENTIPGRVKLIDLTQDFRYQTHPKRTFTYGLPEAHRLHIMNADNIANPGCFATAMELALLPLAAEKVLAGEIHISGITGSTGAGQKKTETSHFSWRDGNISIYKAFTHQHLREVDSLLHSFDTNWNGALNFIPYRGNFTRGILLSAHLKWTNTIEKTRDMYTEYYKSHPFVHIVPDNPDLKQVVNTNKCLIHLNIYDGYLHVISIIDNLVKGASGQAVQNMNLMFGREETTGLQLKPVAF